MSENLLRHETSPYLLQHRDNPVHWRPWGPAALEEATRLQRPILLSIGYAACHWCHVMAHESFEDQATADLMNALFVNIKVDREERPDIDQIYMAALHALGDRGGWPLTMFLTPKGEPIWGGTYFPKYPRYGRPSFATLLREVARLFRHDPERLARNRDALLGALHRQNPEDSFVLDRTFLDSAAERLLSLYDPIRGGVRGAPKFPQPNLLTLLWRSYLRTRQTTYRDAVLLTLRQLCQGGIYDHLAGGFSRYSTDENWLVPHFEKMLYDNAQLISRLSLAAISTTEPLFLQRLEETINWIGLKLLTSDGAFAASFDADTNGEEGTTYLWTQAEIAATLSPAAAERFCTAYDVTPHGNFEGSNILNLLKTPTLSAQAEIELALHRQALLALREQRPQPNQDDKILTDWNGLAITAIAQAAFLFRRPDWLDLATKAYRFISESMTRGTRPGHSYRQGRLVFPGFASDLACLAQAALALYSTSGRPDFLAQAEALAEQLHRHHHDSATAGYFFTAEDADALIARPHAFLDEATPAPDAVAAENLVRLWHLTGNPIYRERVDRLLQGASSRIAGNIFGTAGLLAALDFRMTATLVAIVIPARGGAEPLLQTLRANWQENFILLQIEEGELKAPPHPISGKPSLAGQATAYLCREGNCSRPLSDAEEFAQILANQDQVFI